MLLQPFSQKVFMVRFHCLHLVMTNLGLLKSINSRQLHLLNCIEREKYGYAYSNIGKLKFLTES